MLPSTPSFAFAKAFSTLSRRGDCTVLDPLLHRLTGAGTIVADLRDLRAAMLDELPDGFLRGLGKLSFPHPPHYPPLVALPEGCAAATVNRFLRELPGTECLSAADITPRGAPIHIPTDSTLRLFETTQGHPPLRNEANVPLLLRKTRHACSIVPEESTDAVSPDARLAMVASLRAALCDDDCRLELPPTAAFREMQRQLSATIAALQSRAAALPSVDERRILRGALRMVPRELLPAPAAIAVQDLLRRLPADEGRTGADPGDLSRIARLFADQMDMACPVRGSLRPSRLPRDLVTVARLQHWAWPDSAYARAEPVDDERRTRDRAAKRLRSDWESRRGFDRALEVFAETRVPLPDADLLYRMGVVQAEALAAQSRARRVSFADRIPRKNAAQGTEGAHDPS